MGPDLKKRNIPNWIEGFLQLTDNTEPAEIFREWTAISVIASVLQRKCSLTWSDDLIFYPNLYVVLVGPPGTRKGTAMKAGLSFLREPGLNLHLAAESITREALIRQLNNARDFYDIGDGRMNTHSSLTVFSQEFAVFLGHNNVTMLSDLCDWYDCHTSWKYETKGAGTSDYIDNIWVNIVAATVPELIQTTMPVSVMGNGLASRMIFAYSQKKGKNVPMPSTTDEERHLKKLLSEDLEVISNLKGSYRCTEDFITHWVEFYSRTADLTPLNLDKIPGYADRRPATVLKLCMIVNAARTNSMILSDKDLYEALVILSKVERTMRLALQGIGKNPMSDTLHKIMYTLSTKESFTLSELMAQFISDINYAELQDIIHSLDLAKFITFYENTGKIQLTELGRREVIPD